MSDFPVVRQEFHEAVHGMGADALEDVVELCERVDLESFARGNEAGEDGGGSPTFIASEKEPVRSSTGDSPQASLGAVVVGLQVSALAIGERAW